MVPANVILSRNDSDSDRGSIHLGVGPTPQDLTDVNLDKPNTQEKTMPFGPKPFKQKRVVPRRQYSRRAMDGASSPPLSSGKMQDGLEFGRPQEIPEDELEAVLMRAANPIKRKANVIDETDSDDDDSLDDRSEELGDMDSGSEYTDGSGSELSIVQPTPPFKTIDEERAALLFQFDRLRLRGLHPSRPITATTDISVLRTEMARLRTEVDLESSIRMSRKFLMMIVSGVEWFNNKSDWLDFNLDGWSQSVHDDVSSYDQIFEQLFYKYRNKVSMPPEIQLMLALGGSAVTFHLTSSFMKLSQSRMEAGNPALMESMFKAFATGGSAPVPTNGPPQQQPPNQAYTYNNTTNNRPQAPQPPSFQQQQQQQQQQMQGPGLGSLAGGLGGNMGSMMSSLLGGMSMPPPMATRPPTVDARYTNNTPPIIPFQQPQQQQQQSAHVNHPPPAPESERMSDLVSELSSPPSDLESPRSVRNEDTMVKSLTIRETGGKKNKRRAVVI
jgi:hypothetical protein